MPQPRRRSSRPKTKLTTEERRFKEGRVLQVTPCANCGDPASLRGPRPKTGKRYCSKTDCQSARAKERFQQRSAQTKALLGERVIPTRCQHCGADLPAPAGGTWRAEYALGRWCNAKKACRDARDIHIADLAARADLVEQLEVAQNTVMLLADAVAADSPEDIAMARKVCPACGLASALTLWIHPNAEGARCEGTLDGREPRTILQQGLAAYRSRHYVQVER